MPNDQSAALAPTELVSIEGDDLVIRVTLDALVFATEQGPALEEWDDEIGRFRKVTVTDRLAWRKEVLLALRQEAENGETPVHRLLDNAVRYAVEQGAEGISIEGVLP